jgi:5-methylcytosine-specific restriction endonuclease McrA
MRVGAIGEYLTDARSIRAESTTMKETMPYKDQDRQRQFQRERVRKIRAEYLSGKVCATCGTAEGLEIDHIDPSQKVSHRIWSWSSSRRATELDKCQTLCSPCHKAKTAKGFRGLVHGTHTGYVQHRCRCDLCRAGHARVNREWKRAA